MPANVQTYIGRQAAWHNIGLVKGVHFDAETAYAEGGLDFEVFKSQLQDGLGRKINAWGTFRWNRVDVKTYFAAKTIGDQAGMDAAKANAIFLGTVGESYKVIPHVTGTKMIDALVASKTGAHYETAGVLGEGQTVWALADLALSIRVGGDETKSYLLFATGHDGGYSYLLKAVAERVVCENTLAMALSEKTTAMFRVRHTKNAMERITAAHDALAGITGDIKSVEQKLQFLAGKRVTRESLQVIFDRLFPKTVKNDEGTRVEVSSKQRDVKLAEILSLYENNDGDAFPEQRGTAYNLLNAVTEFTDHVNGGGLKLAARSESALFGSGAKLKSEAFDVILEQANGMPAMTRVDFATRPAASDSLLDQIVLAS